MSKSPKTPAKPSKAAKTKAVLVRARTANAARATRARTALDQIRVLFQKSAEATWDLGHALGEFLQSKLYTALGYASLDDCLAGEGLLSPSHAYRLIRVAHHFSRAELRKVGSVEKADALISYAEATPEHDTAAGLLGADALVGAKRVSKASSADLADATKSTRARAAAGPSAAHAKQSAKAKVAVAREKWLAKHLASQGLKPTRVTTKGSRLVVELDLASVDAIRG